jgi:hypothetical protein
LNANLVNNLEDWQFSSYLDYIGKKHNPFLKTDIILDQFDFPINQVPQRNLVYSQKNLVYKQYKQFINSYDHEKFHLPSEMLIDYDL